MYKNSYEDVGGNIPLKRYLLLAGDASTSFLPLRCQAIKAAPI